MKTYILAVKREMREAAPQDLAAALTGIEGVVVGGVGFDGRVRIDASDEGLQQVRLRLGTLCHIEPVIIHYGTSK